MLCILDVCRRNWPQKIDPSKIKQAIMEYLKHAPARAKRRSQRNGESRCQLLGIDVLDDLEYDSHVGDDDDEPE